VHGVRVESLTKRFETTIAVTRLDLEIQPGELFALLGPSGCGKTTLLRMIAGLEVPTEGEIYFGERRVTQLPVYQRNIGMVFQSYALFPHLLVGDNVAYGLRARKVDESQVQRRVTEALAAVEMVDYAQRWPDQLSGGQQQRVALARALATRPAVLLMDEPLSNLDARLRVSMRDEIRRLIKQVGITTIYVTHDQEEALAIADRIGVMQSGRLAQVGTPAAIYGRPASRLVASFVGQCSFLPGALVASDAAVIGLRPEVVQVTARDGTYSVARPSPAGMIRLPGVVESQTFAGPYLILLIRLESGASLTALAFTPPGSHPEGQSVWVNFAPGAALRFTATGEAIP